MGGRGSTAHRRTSEPMPKEPILPPDATFRPEPPEPTDQDAPAPDSATEEPDRAQRAWERVQASGLENASKEDLLAALNGTLDNIGQRWEIQIELTRRTDLQLQQAARAATEADRTLTPDRASQIRDAIHTAGQRIRPGEEMRMTELRAALPADMPRAEIDAILKRLSKAGEIQLVPHPARSRLPQPDHDNAMWLGGEPNHLIVWNPRE